MRKRGRTTYVPGLTIEEIERIRKEEKIDSPAEAFRKMAKYSRIGQEIDLKKRTELYRPATLQNPFNFSPSKKKKKSNKAFFEGII